MAKVKEHTSFLKDVTEFIWTPTKLAYGTLDIGKTKANVSDENPVKLFTPQ